MEEQLLELPCIQHQRAEEWYSSHSEEPETILLSPREIFGELYQKDRARTAKIRRSSNWYPVYRPVVRHRLKASSRGESAIQRIFQELASSWKKDTLHISSLTRTAMHPAYQSIIGMGQAAIPLILRELQKNGGHWLWALHAISREDPAKPGDDFDAAVQAWLNWGRSRGYI